MAGATLGYVAVIGVGVGTQDVVGALGDERVWHPVADLFEEYLAVSGGDAGSVIALDYPPMIDWAKALPLPTASAKSTTASVSTTIAMLLFLGIVTFLLSADVDESARGLLGKTPP